VKSIKKIREAIGFSQTQMAVFLNVSRSLLNMAEQGKRTLPTTALLKLASLQKGLQNNIPYSTKIQQGQAKEGIDMLHGYVKKSDLALKGLRQQLEQMMQQYGQCLKRALAIGYLLQASGTGPNGQLGGNEKERLLLELAEMETVREMADCSPGKQAILKLEIEAMERKIQMAGKIKF
jgi:transcriptional regulator with XRE-family HTH domain